MLLFLQLARVKDGTFYVALQVRKAEEQQLRLLLSLIDPGTGEKLQSCCCPTLAGLHGAGFSSDSSGGGQVPPPCPVHPPVFHSSSRKKELHLGQDRSSQESGSRAAATPVAPIPPFFFWIPDLPMYTSTDRWHALEAHWHAAMSILTGVLNSNTRCLARRCHAHFTLKKKGGASNRSINWWNKPRLVYLLWIPKRLNVSLSGQEPLLMDGPGLTTRQTVEVEEKTEIKMNLHISNTRFHAMSEITENSTRAENCNQLLYT